jgi:hypothetical protein
MKLLARGLLHGTIVFALGAVGCGGKKPAFIGVLPDGTLDMTPVELRYDGSALRQLGVDVRDRTFVIPRAYVTTADHRGIPQTASESIKATISFAMRWPTFEPFPNARLALEGGRSADQINFGIGIIEVPRREDRQIPSIEERFSHLVWESTRDRPEIGLKEWVGLEAKTGIHVLYTPLVPSVPKQGDGSFFIICGGRRPTDPGVMKCNVPHQHEAIPGLQIDYFFDYSLLPHWAAIDAAVVAKVLEFQKEVR